MSMSNVGAKKGIMFLSSQDFYFITYNIFVILFVLKCFGDRTFRDHRKLPFLVEFSSDHRLIDIMQRYENRKISNAADKQYYLKSYSDALTREKEIFKLLLALERKGYVKLDARDQGFVANVSLRMDKIPQETWDQALYDYEIRNVSSLVKTVKRISIRNLDSMLDKLYGSYGIERWLV